MLVEAQRKFGAEKKACKLFVIWWNAKQFCYVDLIVCFLHQFKFTKPSLKPGSFRLDCSSIATPSQLRRCLQTSQTRGAQIALRLRLLRD